ncbi:MAG: peptidoglycan-binding domain-containing protein [Pseudomonadota bacterium]
MSHSSIEIRLEQYVFGHKGGMGPLGWSESLAKGDLAFLFNSIEDYQGPTYWQEDRWSLGACSLPSGKTAVTVIYPDSDVAGRSTVVGHVLVVSEEDYRKIEGNPFVLQEMGLFSPGKDVPGNMAPLAVRIPEKQLKEACRVTGVSEPVLELVRASLTFPRVVVSAPVPANRMMRDVILCLPPQARARFSFSSMEVRAARSGASDRVPAEKERMLRLQAISESLLKEWDNGRNAAVFSMRDGVLAPAFSGDFPAFSEAAEKYASAIRFISRQNQDLSGLLAQADQWRSNLDLSKYALLLEHLAGKDELVHTAQDLADLAGLGLIGKSGQALQTVATATEILALQDSPQAVLAVHNNLVMYLPGLNHRTVTKYLKPAYESLLKGVFAEDPSRLLLLVQEPGYPESLRKWFQKNFADAIAGKTLALLRSGRLDWGKGALMAATLAGSRDMVPQAAIADAARAAFLYCPSNDWSREEPATAGKFLSRMNKRDVLEIVSRVATRLGQQDAQAFIHFLFRAGVRNPESHTAEIMGALFEKYQGLLPRELRANAAVMLVKVSLESGSAQALQNTFALLERPEFQDLKREVLETLDHHAPDAFFAALLVFAAYGAESSFVYAQRAKRLDSGNSKYFFHYLARMRDEYGKANKDVPKSLVRWARRLLQESPPERPTREQSDLLLSLEIWEKENKKQVLRDIDGEGRGKGWNFQSNPSLPGRKPPREPGQGVWQGILLPILVATVLFVAATAALLHIASLWLNHEPAGDVISGYDDLRNASQDQRSWADSLRDLGWWGPIQKVGIDPDTTGKARETSIEGDQRAAGVTTKPDNADPPKALVQEVQGMLKDLYYYTVAVDGMDGPSTQSAIRRFCRVYKCPKSSASPATIDQALADAIKGVWEEEKSLFKPAQKIADYGAGERGGTVLDREADETRTGHGGNHAGGSAVASAGSDIAAADSSAGSVASGFSPAEEGSSQAARPGANPPYRAGSGDPDPSLKEFHIAFYGDSETPIFALVKKCTGPEPAVQPEYLRELRRMGVKNQGPATMAWSEPPSYSGDTAIPGKILGCKKLPPVYGTITRLSPLSLWPWKIHGGEVLELTMNLTLPCTHARFWFYPYGNSGAGTAGETAWNTPAKMVEGGVDLSEKDLLSLVEVMRKKGWKEGSALVTVYDEIVDDPMAQSNYFTIRLLSGKFSCLIGRQSLVLSGERDSFDLTERDLETLWKKGVREGDPIRLSLGDTDRDVKADFGKIEISRSGDGQKVVIRLQARIPPESLQLSSGPSVQEAGWTMNVDGWEGSPGDWKGAVVPNEKFRADGYQQLYAIAKKRNAESLAVPLLISTPLKMIP